MAGGGYVVRAPAAAARAVPRLRPAQDARAHAAAAARGPSGRLRAADHRALQAAHREPGCVHEGGAALGTVSVPAATHDDHDHARLRAIHITNT